MYIHFNTILSKQLGQSLVCDLLKSRRKIQIVPGQICEFEGSRSQILVRYNVQEYEKTLFYVLDTHKKLRLCLGASHIGFAHELCHVYNYVTGKSQYTSSIKDPFGKWTNMEEMYAIVGSVNYLGQSFMPYNPYNENAFRALFGLPIRMFHLTFQEGQKVAFPPRMSVKEWKEQLRIETVADSFLR